MVTHHVDQLAVKPVDRLKRAPQSLTECSAIVSNTACKSVGALLMTPRTSLVAVCCSVAEASSRSRDSSCWVTRLQLFFELAQVNNTRTLFLL